MIPKFRVFIKANTKTVDGLGYDKDMMHDQVSNIDFYNREVTVWGCGKENCGMCDDTYRLEDITLIQSLGLLDENGKEFFIGDIFSNNQENRLRVVSWEHYDYLKQYGKYGCEILGNIHQHPHLLEK